MTDSAPSVSVLMPVRDGAELLPEAIGSLEAQTLDSFEMVVVDDGSGARTQALLAEWAARDQRVTLIRQRAEGLVPALERARAAAWGRYLARMDADDVAEPDRLRAQLDFLESHPGLSGCGCGVRYFPEELVRDGARRYEAWINSVVQPDDISAAMFVECPLAHPTFFLRAEAVDAVGGYVDRGWPEDYDLVLRLWAGGYRLGKVPDVLHRWREHPNRLSRTSQRYSPDAFLGCKVHYLRSTLLARDRPVVIWGAGPVGKALSRALRAAGTPIEAFVELDPRKIGQEIHGAPVLDADAGARIRGPLHLPAVGQAGARERIETALQGAGMTVLEDYVPVA